MTPLKLVWRSLTYHRRSNLAVALGVAAGTAVLTGALLVGDSVRASLRGIVLDRLGNIDEVLVVDRFFREELAAELADQPEFAEHFEHALPTILLRGTVTNPDSGLRANQVNIIGIDDRFAATGDGAPKPPDGRDAAVINQTLADELEVAGGDEIIVRLPRADDVPADSPWGRKSETIRSLRLKLTEVIPSEGIGRFDLRPTQRVPFNVFVPRATLASALEEPGRVNTLLVTGSSSAEPTENDHRALSDMLQPTLEDYGLRIRQTERGYAQLISNRMLISPAIEQAALEAYGPQGAVPAFTYLANTIAAGEREIPYSTVTAIELPAEPPLGPFLDADGQPIPTPHEDQIVLNRWAADELHVEPGDTIRLDFFEPESTHGQMREASVALTLAAIVELEGAAADPDLVPEVPGVTDQESIADWDAPFPFQQSRIREVDEEYWDEHRGTPKAFVAPATGRRLWGSRFGQASSIQIPLDENATSLDELAARLHLEPNDLGFVFRPVKWQGLNASQGTTSFSALFLGFSMFIIASAVMLVLLLFRLGLDQRASEVGIIRAVGIPPARVGYVLLIESLAVAIVGGLLGVAAGLGYAWLMLAGLRTWWVTAITTPFLQLSMSPLSLIIGGVSGVLLSQLAIAWTLWRSRRVAARDQLAGRTSAALPARKSGAVSQWIAWLTAAAATVTAALAGSLSGEAQAGAFFGSGALALVAALTFFRRRLVAASLVSSESARRGGLVRLAMRNAARNPGRTTLTAGLVAAASFLIVAISAFRLSPPESAGARDSGTGGFTLYALADQPIYQDLTADEGRLDLGFDAAGQQLVGSAKIVALPVSAGDDASCLNLYAPSRPRVVGITPALIERGGFDFAESASSEFDNPWQLLNEALEPDADGVQPVPVIIDMNTALYSLHLWQGVGASYSLDDGRGGELRLRVVGLLRNSILQGDLLIGEAAFRQHFPEVSGAQVFLVDAPADKTDALQQTLEATLGDYGFDAERTSTRLAGFLAVQNTYLSTFQSLGGLGLLLGTFGLATVQLRNVLERRGELALMRATGFPRARLARIVLYENALLLVSGLAIGCAAALIAVAAHLFEGGASIPWASLVATLLTVLVVGLLAGLAAVRTVVTAPLMAALRGE